TIPTPANAVAGGDDPGGPASTQPATTIGGPAVAGGDDPGGPASTRPATTIGGPAVAGGDDPGGPASTRPATTTAEEYGNHIERMLEALRRSPVLRLPGNQTVTFRNVRQPAKTLSLHAEAEIEENPKSQIPNPKLVAFVFGPENGAVSEQLVFHAAKEAYAKSY